ncbi:MAG: hypothetical protein Q8R67_04135 [Rhodoferax sp.]|nr:hypothetical protein [Rhodoferax sp.]MDP3650854.1 hypothetical protein [Rhodoferax sp.]
MVRFYRFIVLAILALRCISIANAAPLDYKGSADLAVTWLIQQRNIVDGSWGATDDMKFVQTSEAVLALAAMNRRTQEYYAGLAWLENHTPINADFMARRILALQTNGGNIASELQYLGTAQNIVVPGNGGLGLSRNYQGEALDTALVLQANSLAGGPLNVSAAISYLIGAQLAGGDAGWSIGQESVSDPVTTAQVLLALIPLQGSNAALPGVIANGLTALNAKVNTGSAIPFQALAALVNLRWIASSTAATTLLNNLVTSQIGGSWEGDIYATALALRALAASMYVDLAVQRDPVLVPDLLLRAAINQSLGRSALDSLNKGELSQLTSLNINGLGVRSLAGLQYATKLAYLDVRNNKITDFTAVAGLNVTILKDGNAGSVAYPMVWNVHPGWNLLGNASGTNISVSALFGDPVKVTSVWKWITSGNAPNVVYPTWAFYTPTLSDGGAAYASSHGYEFLSTTINSGDGFWVVGKSEFSVQANVTGIVDSSGFQSGGPKALSPSWNMIATGDNLTPSDFNKAIGATWPPVGIVPVNLISLWTWDAINSLWYFYAPTLEQTGGLAVYNASKGYKDFGSNTLTSTTGIWMNK